MNGCVPRIVGFHRREHDQMSAARGPHAAHHVGTRIEARCLGFEPSHAIVDIGDRARIGQRTSRWVRTSNVTPDLAPPGGQLLHALAYLSPEEASDGALGEARFAALEAGLGTVCRNPFQSIVVRAVELLQVGDEALAIVDGARTLAPNSINLLLTRAMVYLAQGDLPGAGRDRQPGDRSRAGSGSRGGFARSFAARRRDQTSKQ